MHYHRNQREEFVAYLAARYPKCFFEDPSQRQPLKKNIINDLERERVLEPDQLSQTLDWYMDDFGYRYNLLAGADRIDLNGNKAGTVTPTENREARAWVATRKRELAERKAAPPTAPAAVRAVKPNGPMNGVDHVAKASPSPSLHPALAEMQSAIVIINGILVEKHYEPLRPVLAAAALRDIIGRAEKLIGSLTTNTT